MDPNRLYILHNRLTYIPRYVWKVILYIIDYHTGLTLYKYWPKAPGGPIGQLGGQTLRRPEAGGPTDPSGSSITGVPEAGSMTGPLGSTTAGVPEAGTPTGPPGCPTAEVSEADSPISPLGDPTARGPVASSLAVGVQQHRPLRHQLHLRMWYPSLMQTILTTCTPMERLDFTSQLTT
jgi:hypothetical protein